MAYNTYFMITLSQMFSMFRSDQITVGHLVKSMVNIIGVKNLAPLVKTKIQRAKTENLKKGTSVMPEGSKADAAKRIRKQPAYFKEFDMQKKVCILSILLHIQFFVH